jgi:thioredoxin reductase (NADPH)
MQPVCITVGKTFVTLDLASHYQEYQVMQYDRGEPALDMLVQLRQRQVPVVLMLVDQHLLDMTGVFFLGRAKQLAPTAKCLVVTDQQVKEPLGVLHFKIDAILNTCVPPEDFLFPVVDALIEQIALQARETTFSPLFRGIRVIGHRWSASSHQAKDFLARHSIPFEWVDLETHPERLQAFTNGEDHHPAFPLLQFPDGSWLSQPTPEEIAAKIGLAMTSSVPFYDLIIIGAGPAGLAAAVYGASEGLRTAVIERDVPGGQAGMSSRIENYLGFPVGLSGAELASRGVAQAARLGAHFLTPQEVTSIRVQEPYRYIMLKDGSEIGCYALLLAMGVQYRQLAVPGMDHLMGAGVYYGAAMTEAASCQGKHVYVVGGANSAGQAALYFADYARQVSILVRGEALEKSMSSYLIEEIASRDNIDVQTQTEVIECLGADQLEQLCVMRRQHGSKEVIDADALFVFIGAAPHSQWLPESIARDHAGFVLSGSDGKAHGWPLDRDPFLLETSIPGIFVAGDVRAAPFKRVACATGDGATAVQLIHQYLSSVR